MSVIDRYEFKTTKDGYQLVVYIDPGLTEFSDELGRSPDKKEEFSKFLTRQIKQRFPGLKILSVKVMVGSLLISTLYLDSGQAQAATTTQTQNLLQADVYTVKAGDSLSLIARDYTITVTELREMNNLTSDLIFVGQNLKLPFMTYRVSSGDTLFLIAQRFGTSVDELKAYNKLETNTLLVGQQLRIPIRLTTSPIVEPAPVIPVAPPPEMISYTVVSGDSLSVIAKRYDTTVSEIKIINNLKSNTIFIGQKLQIPQKVEPVPAPEPIKEPEPPKQEVTPEPINITYTVASGDSLSVIAKRYETTVAEIKAINNLTTDTIFVGQKLLIPQKVEKVPEPIPEPEPATFTYTVVAGDTLSVIAKRYGITVDHLKVTNNLTSDMIFVGQKLLITQEKEIIVGVPSFSYFEPINLQNNAAYELTGRAEPNGTVVITLTDADNRSASFEIATASNGDFRQQVDVTNLRDGQLTLVAYSLHPKGTKSGEVTSILIKDTDIARPLVENDLLYINRALQTEVKFFGAAKPNAAVYFTITDENGDAVSGETAAKEDGAFFTTVDLSGLADSKLEVVVKQRDTVGNTSEATVFHIEKDTNAPEMPAVTMEEFINNQNQQQFLLAGTAEKNAEILISIFANNAHKTMSVLTNDAGDFHVPVDLSEFADGEVTIELSQQDKAGNQSEISRTVVLKDTSVPVIEMNEVALVSPENQVNYSLVGTTKPNSAVDITVSDGSQEVKTSVRTDEAGFFEAILDLSVLDDGELQIFIAATDRYGNKGSDKQLVVEKDTFVPIELSFTNAEIINMHNQFSYLIRGVSNHNDGVVHVEVTDGVTSIFETTDVVDGKFETSVDLSQFGDGKLEFRVKQAGKQESDLFTFSVEKKTEITTPTLSRSGYFVDGNQTFLNIVGVGDPRAVAHVAILDVNGNQIRTETTTVNASGIFNITINVTNEGSVSYIVTTEDRVGNISEAVTPALLSHKVVAGDTLSQIALRYNTTVQGIKAVNRMTGDVIFAGQVLKLPVMASTTVNLGYMYFGHPSGFTSQVLQTGHSLNVVSPSYFDINADGTLKLTYQVDPTFVSNMHNMGVRVVPFLSNHWDRELGRAMIANPERAAQEIYNAIMKYNLDGINVDIENITDRDRANFTTFVRLLREKLPASKEVSVAVAANPNGWTQGWHGAYDYPELAKYADYLMIMTYDESYHGGPAGPVASLPWVERSVQYALTQNVPSQKIVIGMAHFGRYWIEGQELGGYGVSNTQIQEMLSNYDHEVIFDSASQSVKAVVTIKAGDPVMYRLGTPLAPGTYTVWYEDERSLKAKASLVQKYNLKGIGHWSIGQENPTIWAHYPTWQLPQQPVNGAGPVTETAAPEEENFISHTVVSGDTLWRLANQYGTTVAQIKEANNLVSDNIFVGQILKIPK